jgi:tight adherence protein B
VNFFSLLISSAGLYSRRKETFVLAALAVILSAALTQATTDVLGLSLSLSALTAGAVIEAIRLRARSRQNHLDRLWPRVFDSFQNATQSGLSLQEQLEYLGTMGPIRLRLHFARLHRDLGRGNDITESLEAFREAIGSRQGDALSLLIEVTTELGTAGVAESWRKAAANLRSEQAMFGEVIAKQGWVLGSAKVALVAPWLVAFLLVRLEQNRAAFETGLGALVLLTGLLLSLLAYVAVNKLGSLTLPGRIFNATF